MKANELEGINSPHNACCYRYKCRQQQAENEALKAKTLTDEEINKLWAKSSEDGIAMQQGFTTQQHYFVYLILKKV